MQHCEILGQASIVLMHGVLDVWDGWNNLVDMLVAMEKCCIENVYLSKRIAQNITCSESTIRENFLS